MNGLRRLFLPCVLALMLLASFGIVDRPVSAQAPCDLVAIGAVEQLAHALPPGDARTALVVIRLESAARALRSCANAGQPVAPRYKLRLEALNDWDLQLRLLAAEHTGALDSPYIDTDFEVTLLRLVAVDPEAPQIARNAAREKQLMLCTTPSALSGPLSHLPICSAPVLESGPVIEPSPPPIAANTGCNVQARTIHAVVPALPPDVAALKLSGEVWVQITIDATGVVTNAKISRSPDDRLNDAALLSARSSTFAPEIRDCKPIAGSFVFVVEFFDQ